MMFTGIDMFLSPTYFLVHSLRLTWPMGFGVAAWKRASSRGLGVWGFGGLGVWGFGGLGV